MPSHPLTLPSTLSIRHASAVRDQLLAALAQHDAVEVEFPDGCEADLSLIQLIEAARRHADSHGKRLTLKAAANGRVFDVLERGGFLADMAPAFSQFWLHRKEIQ
ncbi:STAS domain-containing protein [Rhizobium sp. CECT 9324]|uniref:STAS domain-containing protein n=1 Tax=Rhizobium sp. CECT 9324 TaxID=2845820 RepID=UPI001E3E733D|nr:STAS domain-containing protein [Rhizobium sp. CECT 9324]CAH0342072.1 hypothetical protein RHI9324_03782 [Rhizobium sp. CECT 9324]